MYTFLADKNWRIHHDGDFSGDITFVCEHNHALHEQFHTTISDILKAVKDGSPVFTLDGVLIESTPRHNSTRPIEKRVIPVDLLKKFVAERYIDWELEDMDEFITTCHTKWEPPGEGDCPEGYYDDHIAFLPLADLIASCRKTDEAPTRQQVAATLRQVADQIEALEKKES